MHDESNKSAAQGGPTHNMEAFNHVSFPRGGVGERGGGGL